MSKPQIGQQPVKSAIEGLREIQQQQHSQRNSIEVPALQLKQQQING